MREWRAPEDQHRYRAEGQKNDVYSPTGQGRPEPEPVPDSPEVQLATEWAHLGGD